MSGFDRSTTRTVAASRNVLKGFGPTLLSGAVWSRIWTTYASRKIPHFLGEVVVALSGEGPNF